MKFFEWLTFLLASVIPSGEATIDGPVVEIFLPANSTLVAEEQTEIRVGDKFSAVILDPETKEIFSQSEWIEVTK